MARQNRGRAAGIGNRVAGESAKSERALFLHTTCGGLPLQMCPPLRTLASVPASTPTVLLFSPAMRSRLFFVLAALLPAALHAQTPGQCSPGDAVADLDIGNVRARLYNTGGLFWKGAGSFYNVPKAPEGQPITPNAIFASGVWLGGKVGSEVRQAAATYGDWELWPGPLALTGDLPSPTNCTPYDRIFVVSRQQVQDFLAGGQAAPDLAQWPTGLGAPAFVDANANGLFDSGEARVVPTSRDQTINLAAGELPALSGDQMAWWIMNDVGNGHKRTNSKPIGLEVQVSAFAFNREGTLGNTTFYRYKLVYRGQQPFTDAWFGLFSDPDLGNATDDYVGSDTTLGMAYVYNADNFDEGQDGYGTAPPALGYSFLQGPLVPAPGQTWTDPDGTVHPDQRRLGMTRFINYESSPSNSDPRPAYYEFLQGLWQDGSPMRDCGDGEGEPTCGVAHFMWPGDPVTATGWSERNLYPESGGPPLSNVPNDRRFLLSTGPFEMQPGSVQDVAFAIVWARGATHLSSITALRQASRAVQQMWDENGVTLPPVEPPPAPSEAPLLLAPAPGATGQPDSVALHWSALAGVSDYVVELTWAGGDTLLTTPQPYRLAAGPLGIPAGSDVSWRVRGFNAGGTGPWSEGRTFTVTAAPLRYVPGGFGDFLTVANANGPLDPPEYAAFAFNGSGFPHPTTADRPDGSRQQSGGLTDSQGWGIFTFGDRSTYDQWFSRATRDGGNFSVIGENDFEWRFGGTSIAHAGFSDPAYDVTVPFEIWNIGVGTPDDPSDDFRMIPYICESDCGAGGTDGVFDIGGDSPLSGGADDPISDAIYWYNPLDTSPGEAGYLAYENGGLPDLAALGGEVLARTALMGWNFGKAGYPQTQPESGTIFRIVWRKAVLDAPVPGAPLPGTVFSTTTAALFWTLADVPVAGQVEVQLALDDAFTTPVRTDVLASGTLSIDLWGLAPGTQYWWRVRQQATTQNGMVTTGPWSAPQPFAISATATDAEAGAEMPAALAFAALAPHPVRDVARVRVALPRPGHVRLVLYDVLGRELARVLDADRPAGWHDVPLDASALGAGVYFLRVTSGGEQQVRSFVVVR